jgi:hypothetical protein
MRNLARLACLVPAVALLAAGCSSSPATGSAPSGSAPTGKAFGAASPTATATPSTGTQLTAALITDVPTGFKINKSGTLDTGTDMQDEKNGPMKSTSHCGDLGATAWIDVSGMSGVAFAQSDYLDGDEQEIAQEIDSFDSPADAARALSQLTAFMKTCKTFKDPSTASITYHLAVSSASGLGDGAIKGVTTSPNIEGGVVEVAAVQGNNVITVLYSSTKLSTAQHAVTIATQIHKNLTA